MTDSPSINYETAFNELTTLNHIFATHHDTSVPTLNRDSFRVREDSYDHIVVEGLHSGMTFMAQKHTQFGGSKAFGRFAPAKTASRIVVDWVLA